MNRSLVTLLSISFVVLSQLAVGGVRLPLHSLRDQSSTSHCWAYAMSHALESRALHRDGIDSVIDIERDAKYWVDYERLMAIYKSKNKEIYFGEYEGGWQIEFYNAFLKHGKSFFRAESNPAQILYPYFEKFDKHLAFMPGPTNPHDPTLPTFDKVREEVEKSTKSEEEVKKYVFDFLDRYYGKPAEESKWLQGQTLGLTETAEALLGDDFENHSTVNDLILVKPVTDGDSKWVKYLGERFWGYRYESAKLLDLVRHSLDNGWPVTFDNVFHAMTILGYETKDGGDTFYAVADSGGGTITWYPSQSMLSNLNMASFFKESIEGMLPNKPKQAPRDGVNYDKRDNVTFPPM